METNELFGGQFVADQPTKYWEKVTEELAYRSPEDPARINPTYKTTQSGLSLSLIHILGPLNFSAIHLLTLTPS